MVGQIVIGWKGVLSIMRWNWQRPDCPESRFDADRLRAAGEQFLKSSGVVIGSLHYRDAGERDGLTIELISQAVIDNSP